MNRLLLVAGLLSTVLCLASVGTAQEPAKADKDIQDIVFFSETRPVLIRLHIRSDGKPLQAVWDDFLRSVFQSLDTDKDGVLNRAEAEKAPPAQLLFGGNFFGGGALPTFDQLDGSRDGKVTPEELGAYYRANGGASFQVGGGSQRQQFYYVGQSVAPSADALNEAIFKLLDTDKDGKLSKDELTKTPTVLLTKDADDDEILEPYELTPGPNPNEYERFAAAQALMQGGGGGVPTIRAINPGDSPTELVRQLLTRYGPKGQGQARKLTRKEFALDEASFKQLDADEDGELDSEELARFARRAPDLELAVRVGKFADKEAPVEIISGKDKPLSAHLHKSKEGGVYLNLGNTRLDLRIGGGDGMPVRALPNIKETYKMQFSAADADNNGYLEMKEVQQGRFFGPLFKLMDADNDGMLYEKEMLAYLDRMQEMQARATASCASLSVSDQGRGLFDLIDTNRDGRLGVYEMRNAVNLVQSLDRDSDAKVGKDEVPRSYQANLSQGPSSFNPYGGRVVFAAGGMGRTQPAPETTAGPVWFRKMDLNRDGFVSVREFLGTPTQFKEIDADGDKLISVKEAEQADAAQRKPKESGR